MSSEGASVPESAGGPRRRRNPWQWAKDYFAIPEELKFVQGRALNGGWNPVVR